jgi:predicted ABC-type ATPase
MRRAARGGHSASERTLGRIHASSPGNLPTALIPASSGIDIVQIYDNSRPESRPTLVLEAPHGKIVRLADRVPDWLKRLFGWTDGDIERHMRELANFRRGH